MGGVVPGQGIVTITRRWFAMFLRTGQAAFIELSDDAFVSSHDPAGAAPARGDG
jgi:hypothetical protein